MKLKTKLNLKFLYNFNFNKSLKKKNTDFNLKTFIYFLLIINYFFKNSFKIKFKKKKFNKFTILKAPYKNKLAQRHYFISRYYFSINFFFNQNLNNKNFLEELKFFRNFSSLFFYNILISFSFFI